MILLNFPNRLDMQNLLKNNFHIFTLILWVSIFLAFPQTTSAKKKEGS